MALATAVMDSTPIITSLAQYTSLVSLLTTTGGGSLIAFPEGLDDDREVEKSSLCCSVVLEDAELATETSSVGLLSGLFDSDMVPIHSTKYRDTMSLPSCALWSALFRQIAYEAAHTLLLLEIKIFSDTKASSQSTFGIFRQRNVPSDFRKHKKLLRSSVAKC